MGGRLPPDTEYLRGDESGEVTLGPSLGIEIAGKFVQLNEKITNHEQTTLPK